MRFLAGGRGSARFAAVFQFADAVFAPSKASAWVQREEQRRRKVAVPAPSDPPADGEEHGPADAAVAVPRDLLGPVEIVAPDDDPGPQSAGGEHDDDPLEKQL